MNAWLFVYVLKKDLSRVPGKQTLKHQYGHASVVIRVSCISSWELAQLVQRIRLQLALNVRDWLASCEALPFVSFLPVTTAIAIESTRLPNFPHNDPADRIIVATALSLGAVLVTKYEKVQRYKAVQTIW